MLLAPPIGRQPRHCFRRPCGPAATRTLMAVAAASPALDDVVSAVRRSAAFVAARAKSVSIDDAAVLTLASKLGTRAFAAEWDAEAVAMHYQPADTPAGADLMLQYLLVVDALNFCFWPEPGLEYEHLSRGLAAALTSDPTELDAARLAACSPATLRRWFAWPRPLPAEDQRAALVREVGLVLEKRFAGKAAELVRAAGGSAPGLVSLVADSFPGFRDVAVYAGVPVAHAKRAQIFAADVWGAFGGRGPGALAGVDALTMFADYRVPVVLRTAGVLVYAPELAAIVDSGTQELPAGGAAEVEIRSCCIEAVERVRAAMGAGAPTAVQLDWALWATGEAGRSGPARHHRTRTTFY